MSVAKVYISGRFIYRALREDSRGLYIKYSSNQRVNVRLDPYTRLYYIAVKPSKPSRALVELKREYRQLVSTASCRESTSQEQLLEIRKQLTNLRREIKISSSFQLRGRY